MEWAGERGPCENAGIAFRYAYAKCPHMRRPDPTKPIAPIETIIVSESDMASPSPDGLAFAVTRFVDEALSHEYLPAELPREALIAHWVFCYEGEVMNGGHAQFVGNRGDEEGIFDFVADGLETLGLDEVASIFSDLRTFSGVHPKRFARCYGNHEQLDPYFDELDSRFYALPAYAITAALGGWLKTRPWISVISQDLYRSKIGRLVPAHPLQDARRELRRPANEAAMSAFIARFARSRSIPTKH